MPKKLKILEEPHPFLRQTMKAVEDVTAPKIKELVSDMIFTMHQAKGIGLAAIQVEVDARLIVIDTKDGTIALINPEIIERSKNFEIEEEGCLSVPKKFAPVKRNREVKVTAHNVKGEAIIYDAKGLFARVLQHEIDHLNGVLFIDLIEDFTQDQRDEVFAGGEKVTM